MLAVIIEIQIVIDHTRLQITVVAYNVAARVDPPFGPDRRSVNGIRVNGGREVYRSKLVVAA